MNQYQSAEEAKQRQAEIAEKPWGLYRNGVLCARAVDQQEALAIARQLKKLGTPITMIYEGRNLGVRREEEYTG